MEGKSRPQTWPDRSRGPASGGAPDRFRAEDNYPWPEAPSEKQRAAVEAKAQAVLDARARYPASSLADLYDPLSMPPDLVKAHAELDRAVDLCYRFQPFSSDAQRVEFLFALYEKLTAPLAAAMALRPARPRPRSGATSDPGTASAEPGNARP